ncbi:hypothetical protein [Enterococcus phage phiSHEF13]|uniref:Uncharacterized protein n=3 Tax=Schiekvirus TaxID=2732968 RepID=A0A411B7B9_9CAUD|nr:hypothetical protein EfsSzw1_18 [Enterococcus phage EfsSzw-1]UMO76780.1 hypothetical protein [Enterococcus phage phiSHEF13]UVD42972.1 hypothetical protein [Enterococcus phage TJE1]
MKYLIYVLLTIEGAIILFASYALGYGVYWELTNEASRPTPWLTITLCGIGILLLIATFILQIASFRQANRYDLF